MTSDQLTWRYLTIWYAAWALLMLSATGVWQNTAFWALSSVLRLPLQYLVGAYLVSGVAIGLHYWTSRAVRLWPALRTTSLVFGLAFLLLILSGAPISRLLAIGVFVAGLGSTIALVLVPRHLKSLALLVILLAACVTATAPWWRPEALAEPIQVRLLPSSLHSIQAVLFSDRLGTQFANSNASGGGIASFGDRYLVATWRGELYVIRRDQDSLGIELAVPRVPMNSTAFKGAMTDPRVELGDFRTHDIFVQERPGNTIRVLASHHYWKDDSKCFVLRLSMMEGNSESIWQNGNPNWRTLFETTPCLPIKPQGDPFKGAQAGGLISLIDDDTVLMTVGDHQFDGVNHPLEISQDMQASYGKIMKIDIATGRSEIFSSGHRNPQGLVVTADGSIWSTEHGPKGGDELNNIQRGANYGWPLETYGTNYRSLFWPRSESQGRHGNFVRPSYAWVPSIGVSNLIEVTGDKFDRWTGDLLVASLVGKQLFRVRIEDDHQAVVVEPILVGHRIRSIAMGHDGSIVLWLNEGRIMFLEPADEERRTAELSFAVLCSGCHVVRDGASHGIGPDLDGVAARQVATASGYVYSEALSGLGGRWTGERLEAFLTDAQSVAPGTRMGEIRVDNPETRDAIVKYLLTLE